MPGKSNGRTVRSSADWARILIAVLDAAGVESSATRLPQLLRQAERQTGMRLAQAMGPAVAAAVQTRCSPGPVLQLTSDVLRHVLSFILPMGFVGGCSVAGVCQSWRQAAQWWQFRRIDTDGARAGKCVAYLLRAVRANAEPVFLRLRLGARQWALLPWLLDNIDASQLRCVQLYVDSWAAPLDCEHDALPHFVRAALRGVGSIDADAMNGDGDVYEHLDGKEMIVADALDHLTTLQELKLIGFAPCSGLPQKVACKSLTALSTNFLSVAGCDAAAVELGQEMLSHGLVKLSCHFFQTKQVEELLPLVPNLRELAVSHLPFGCQSPPVRLISASLEKVSMVNAGKVTYISYIDCPLLRVVKATGYVYGNGFVGIRTSDAIPGQVPGTLGTPWNKRLWHGVYTEAAGFSFCYLRQCRTDQPREELRLIGFGQRGRPPSDCVWELLDWGADCGIA